MPAPKLLAFAGTTRESAYNKKLARAAAELAREAGADVTFIDLRDYPMPLYDGDVEAKSGKPEAARHFKKQLVDHDGFIISTGEYNSSITGVLKNAIDWASRADEGDPKGGAAAFRGKTVALLSAAPGGLGGMRALVHVRAILGALGCYLLPGQVAVPRVAEVFDDAGTPDEQTAAKVNVLVRELIDVTRKLNG